MWEFNLNGNQMICISCGSEDLTAHLCCGNNGWLCNECGHYVSTGDIVSEREEEVSP